MARKMHYIIRNGKRQTMFVARRSDHIEEDTKRNWSSWNFGENGFTGTKQKLIKKLETVTDEHPVTISGFEIWPHNKEAFRFGELYKNYWVIIDTINAQNGLSCIILKADNLEDATNEALNRRDYWGDGASFDANEAKLVYSKNDIHVFEIVDE
jgi:hypothetical protein